MTEPSDTPSPNRPNSAPVSTANKLSNAVALAKYISTLQSRFVLILEAHQRPFYREIFEGEALQKLIDSGIHHYCEEFPRDINEHRLVLEKRKNTPPLAHPFLRLAARNSSAFTAHAIDHQMVTNDEILAEVNVIDAKAHERPFYLIERLIIGETKRNPLYRGIPDSYILNQFTGLTHQLRSQIRRDQTVDLQHIFFPNVPQDVMETYVRRMRSPANLYGKMMQEWELLTTLEARLRIEGKADAHSVTYMLSVLKPDERALLKYGAAHGLLEYNGGTLAQQIGSQAKALGQDGSLETVMVLKPEDAGMFHHHITEYSKKYPVRWSAVRVWDYEKQQEWPLKEWYENAHSIYGAKANIHAPNKTP